MRTSNHTTSSGSGDSQVKTKSTSVSLLSSNRFQTKHSVIRQLMDIYIYTTWVFRLIRNLMILLIQTDTDHARKVRLTDSTFDVRENSEKSKSKKRKRKKKTLYAVISPARDLKNECGTRHLGTGPFKIYIIHSVPTTKLQYKNKK